jgi:hypothetical protein
MENFARALTSTFESPPPAEQAIRDYAFRNAGA